MPVGLETQAMRGGPPPSMLSPEGIARLRLHAIRQSQQNYQLHTNATTLMRDQWLHIDTLLLRVAEQYMAGVLDLTSRGLTQTITSLGDAASMYQTVTRMDPALTDMRMSAAGNNQRLSVAPHMVPLPFAYEDWEFDLTEVEAMQRNGGTLDTAYAEEAMRSVDEKFEDWLFNGAPDHVYDGLTLYGYRTHPQRITGSGATWTDPDNIYPTILAMVNALIVIQRPGPYALYMNVLQYGQMFAMEGVDRAWNMFRRIQESFPQIVSIKPVYAMPAGQLVLVELQRRTIDLAIKMDPANVPWDIMGGLAQHVRVIGSIVPRIKVDGGDKVGVVHYTGVA
jgi:uncharacterized linocin/CFP29 family protein